MRPWSFTSSLVLACLGSAASAATFSASFSGDVCSIPPAITEFGEANCSLIEQAGSPKGIFALKVSGVDKNIVGNAKITITSSSADLFQSDQRILERGGDRNDLDEYFGLALESLNLGVLFDSSTADEAAVSSELADSVLASISAAAFSSDSILLEFSLSEAQMKPLLADGVLSAIFDFRFGLFDDNYNVNRFFDPAIVVEYEVGVSPVPLPGAAGIMLLGLGCLAALRRRG